MVRLIVVIATVSVIAIVGLIIFVISWGGESSPSLQDEASTSLPVTVSINAIPWGRVLIKLPQGDDFIEPRAQDFTMPPEPNQKKSNVTPIRGGLKVPIGTTIKLVYKEREKVFSYEEWKNGQSISHDFLNQ